MPPFDDQGAPADPLPDDRGQRFYARNQAWVKPGASGFNTALDPDAEQAFRGWLAENKVPFDPAAKVSDYDMRGFWQGLQAGDPKAASAIDPNDNRLHYPDYWKTPYHESFSAESQWATDAAPRWNDDDQLVGQDGSIVYDDRAPKPHMAFGGMPDDEADLSPDPEGDAVARPAAAPLDLSGFGKPLDFSGMGKPIEAAAPAGKPLDFSAMGKPLDFSGAGKPLDAPAAPAADTEPKGFFGTLGSSTMKGIKESLTDVAHAPTALSDDAAGQAVHQQEADGSYVGQLLQKKLSEGWSDPNWWAASIGHGIGASSPSLALGMAGTGAGTAIAPGLGTLIGGASGFALGSALQTIAPAYSAARAEGLNHDEAVTRALTQTGIASAFGAAMGLTGGASLFGREIVKDAAGNVVADATGKALQVMKRPVSEALAQIFGVQPGLGVAQQATEAVSQGKPVPTLDELATGYAGNVGMGVGMVGAHKVMDRGLRTIRGEPAGENPAPSTELPPGTPAEPPPAPTGAELIAMAQSRGTRVPTPDEAEQMSADLAAIRERRMAAAAAPPAAGPDGGPADVTGTAAKPPGLDTALFGQAVPPIDKSAPQFTEQQLAKAAANRQAAAEQEAAAKAAEAQAKEQAQGELEPVRRPDDLLEFLSKNGGVRDDTGDLSAMDAHLWHTNQKFRRRLVRDDGDSLPGAFEKANEAGYGPFHDEAELLDAIHQNLTGEPQFAAPDMTEAARWREAQERQKPVLDQLRERASDLGLEIPENWTGPEILAEIHEREGMMAEGHQADGLADQHEADSDAWLKIVHPDLYQEIHPDYDPIAEIARQSAAGKGADQGVSGSGTQRGGAGAPAAPAAVGQGSGAAADNGARPSSKNSVAPSTPEPRSDIDAQIRVMASGETAKDAVFIAAGNEGAIPPKLPEGVIPAVRPEGVLLTTNPVKAKRFREKKLKDAELGDLLGYPVTKDEAIKSGAPVVVQGKDAAGNVVAEAVTSPQRAGETADAIKAQVPADGTVTVGDPVALQQRRAALVAQERAPLDLRSHDIRNASGAAPSGARGAEVGEPFRRPVPALDADGAVIAEDAGRRSAPVRVASADDLGVAERHVNTAPSEAQASAGNYAKGHIKIHGLDVAIENPKGSVRRGVDTDGKPWETVLPAAYGYIKRTSGADGDHVDAYIGDHPESDRVFLIDQHETKGERPFDEHKALIGFPDSGAAFNAYFDAFSDGSGPERMGHVAEMSVDQFKDWLKRGDTKAPARAAVEPTTPMELHAVKHTKTGADLFAVKLTDRVEADRFKELSAAAKKLGGYYSSFRGKGAVPGWQFKTREAGEQFMRDNGGGLAPRDDVARKPPVGATEAPAVAPEAANVKPAAPTDRTRAFPAYTTADLRATLADGTRRRGMSAETVAKMEEELRAREAGESKPRVTPQVPAPAADKRAALREHMERQKTPIGTNADGHPIHEDARGVRSYVRDGIRVSEPVGMRPDGAISVDPSRRGDEFSTEAERAAAGPQESSAKALFRKMIDGTGASRNNGDLWRIVPDVGSGYAVERTPADGRRETFRADQGRDPWTLDEARAEAVNRAFPAAEERGKSATAPSATKSENPPDLSTAPAEAPPQAAPNYGASNKVFTKDAAERAREILRKKLSGSQLNSGLDPELIQAGVTLAGYHVEAGARKFADFAKAMSEDLGDAIRPYLRQFYEMVRYHPGFDAEGMSDHAEIQAHEQAPAEPLNKIGETPNLKGERPSTPEAKEAGNGLQEPVPARDEGAGSEAVHGTAEERQAGRAPAAEEPRGAPDAGGGAGERAEGRGGAPEERGSEASRGEAGAGDDAGLPAAERPDDGGAAGRPAPDGQVAGTNFHIEPGAVEEARTPRVKARDNVAAIELAKKLIGEGRPATREEQAVLAKYVGWGGLSGAFENSNGAFGKGLEATGKRLKELLSEDEHKTASRSTQYAHYTSEKVIRSMWDAIGKMGFKGGLVFEPGMGVGHFLGMMPPDLAQRSKYQGVEMDHLTADIAKLLYPESGVRQGDFTKTPIPENAFDLVIGNPPFSDTVIQADPKYAARGFMLHDYFFAKSLDSVRPGGLLGFVTSAGTMNKMDPAARQYMAERAEFVGGVRLPSSAFKQNAGTEVTTDILFFKKRGEVAAFDENNPHPPWTETVPRTFANPREGELPQAVNVNRYFAEHPEQILGDEGLNNKQYAGARYGVEPRPGQDLSADLAAAMERLPKDVMGEAPSPADRAALDFDSGQKKDGSFYLQDGKLMQYSGGAGRPVEARGAGVTGGKTAGEMHRIRMMVPLRDALRDVFKHDLTRNDEGSAAARVELNRHYDNFVKQFGPINKAEFQYRRPTAVQAERMRAEAREAARDAELPFEEGDFDPTGLIEAGKTWAEIGKERKAQREAAEAAGRKFNEGTFDPAELPDIVIEKRPNIDPFGDDPESYRLRSIEEYNDTTGASSKKRIFNENILTFDETPKLASAHDGVLWSLNKFGRLDLDAIAKEMGTDRNSVISELGDKVYRIPGTTGDFVTADEYLSGDVVDKLETARAQAERDPSVRRNVEALEKAQPVPLAPSEISMGIGMPWIPHETMEAFARDHLGIGEASITHSDATGGWSVSLRGAGERSREWGTDDRSASELLKDALNKTPPKITKTDRMPDGSKRTYVDAVATQAAQDKYEAIRNAFNDYLQANPERANQHADIYNAKMNRVVLRQYDGSYMKTPGVSADWSWRPHQQRVVSRIVQSGNTYMAHAVGAGKTSAMIGAGMEMRRLGLVRKPMYVVPGHMLGQFAKEFYEQYPTARIAVADERRFHTDRRKQFMADVAQNDLDAVIIPHSSFGMIPISEEFRAHLIREEIAKLDEALGALEGNESDRITIKRIENQKEKLEQKLSTRGNARQDQGSTFEEMGTDFLFVDEAHKFRKLSYATRQSGLKGLAPEGSNMAWDLYSKMRYLDDQRPGRSAVLASGTPITNTMGELYSISRFLQPHELEKRGIGHFDSWAATFGDTKAGLEQQPDGSYAPVTRFAKFVNMPELYKMVGSIMDTVTPEQLEQYVVRPKLAGGERKLHLAPRTDFLDDYQGQLASRMEAIKKRKGPPQKGDDILLSVINDGRHSAIDPRFVDPSLPPDPDSKLNMMIANVHQIWKDTKNQQFYDPKSNYEKKLDRGPATQMIFANLGVGDAREFSGYQWIKGELLRRGVPRDQIAFIGDYKSAVARQKLFNDMNEGKVRILIGSTDKMGTGVNAQRRLVALHNQDPLWYPADDEQRVGRILRQGNTNPEIQVHDYSTKGTYDSTMWQMMGRKGRFIEQFFRGDPELRDMEDIGAASMYEQASAIATSDPRIIQLTEMKQALDKAERRAAAHDREQYAMRKGTEQANRDIEYADKRTAQIQQDIAQRTDTRGKAFKMEVAGKTIEKRPDAAKALAARVGEAFPGLGRGADIEVAKIGGFPLMMRKNMFGKSEVPEYFLLRNGEHEDEIEGTGATGIIAAAENRLSKIEEGIEHYATRKANAQRTLDQTAALIGKQFQGGDEIKRLRDSVKQLESDLTPKEEPKGPVLAVGDTGEDEPASLQRGAKDQPEGAPEAAPGTERQLTPTLTGDERPTETYTAHEKDFARRFTDIVKRLFPAADPRLFARMRTSEAGGESDDVLGAHYGARNDDGSIARVIAGSLRGEDPEGTARHEGIHYILRAGLLTDAERSALIQEADRAGWVDDKIKKEYGHLPEAQQLEEGIAEAYRRSQVDPTFEKSLSGLARKVFYKAGLMMRQVASMARQVLGKDATADDVFRRIESGDVGRRGGDQGEPGIATERPAALQRQSRGPDDEPEETPRSRTGNALRDAAAAAMDVVHDLQMKVAPMARGSDEARSTAKDFANALRLSRYEWGNADEWLKKEFTPDERARMWKAADEQSVAEQQGLPTEGIGLSRLSPRELAAVDRLQAESRIAWNAAVEAGMVEGSGLPSYVPRMVVNLAEGRVSPLKSGDGGGGRSLDRIGNNLRTTTAQLKHREHMTAAETEAAAQAKFGDDATVVKDIRTLSLATGKLFDAVAGKRLIDRIREIGEQTGEQTVSEDGEPGDSPYKWFTLDHPAFQKWAPRLKVDPETGKTVAVKDAAGNTIFDRKDIHVREDFEGPLRAVLSKDTGKAYGAMMDLKAKTMGLIMYSPLIHNAVEWGRALPAMPGKVATFKIYFEGNRAKNDPAQMREAINAGMAPIGHRAGRQDITSIVEDPEMKPGRSWTSQVLAAVPGLFDPRAGDAVKRWVDKAGDFWHNTLLWDRVGDLQMGLYTNLRDHLVAKGSDYQSASRAAAHFANRYAGALPAEAMSTAARKVANLTLFSRSFTLGNLGAMKDMVSGLPRDVQAQILRDKGTQALENIQSYAKRKAVATIALDIALMYAGNAALQSGIAILAGDSSLDKEAQGYARRLNALMQRVAENPLEVLNPFETATALTPMADNEPGKQDRVLVGYASDGTAIYMRNPAGKIGEEFTGWATGPLDMIRKKLGTIARPTLEVISNDQGFGRKVYDPGAKTPTQWVQNIGRIVGLYMGGQIPLQTVQAARDWYAGRGDSKVSALQVMGPFAGLTFSKGAPGGPAVGQMYAARTEHEFKVQKAMPDIRRQIQDGDVAGAQAKMQELGMPRGLQAFYIRTTQDPKTRLSKTQMKAFQQYATPEQVEAMERFQQQQGAR